MVEGRRNAGRRHGGDDGDREQVYGQSVIHTKGYAKLIGHEARVQVRVEGTGEVKGRGQAGATGHLP